MQWRSVALMYLRGYFFLDLLAVFSDGVNLATILFPDDVNSGFAWDAIKGSQIGEAGPSHTHRGSNEWGLPGTVARQSFARLRGVPVLQRPWSSTEPRKSDEIGGKSGSKV